MPQDNINGGSEERLIHRNPCEGINQLAKNSRARGILEQREASKILSPKNWEKVWNGKRLCYIGNLLAAITGMRAGEIRALQVDSLKHDSDGQPYILVHQSADQEGNLKETKTGLERCILIPPELETHLAGLARFRKDGLIFSLDGGQKPVDTKYFSTGLYGALAAIGVQEEERKARNITFHSWRHFANTTYRAFGIPDAKVQAMTGHTTQAMTELLQPLPCQRFC